MMVTPRLTLLSLALNLVLPSLASAIPDLSDLSAEQQETFNTVAQAEFCSCTSAYTLAGCNEARAKCPVADKVNTVLLKAVRQGLSAEEIIRFLAQDLTGPFCDPPISLEADITGAPAKGATGAAVTVIEFADFRCSHCRAAVPGVRQALKKHADAVRFYFVPYPIQDHAYSYAAAEALLAAGAQGRAWEMYDALFSSDSIEFDTRMLVGIAVKIGLDSKRFETDLTTRSFLPQVRAFKAAGQKAGIQGTPTFFVNGRRAPDAPSIVSLADAIEMALARGKGDC